MLHELQEMCDLIVYGCMNQFGCSLFTIHYSHSLFTSKGYTIVNPAHVGLVQYIQAVTCHCAPTKSTISDLSISSSCIQHGINLAI